MVRFLGSQRHFSVLARPHADLSANTRCFHAYGACVSRACLGVPHTTALRNTIIGTTSTNLPGQRLGAPPLYNRSLRVLPAPTRYDRDQERDKSSRSSTLARGHSGAQHRRAPRSACESRHSCRHPLSNSGPGSFALCAQAPGPRPYDILVWK